jgi:uncharacterized membrane protein YphA (DoxX/SURF4 family)
MKSTNILYWIFTGLMVALMLFSGISALASPVQSQALIHGHLGYPEYFTPLISVAKLVGVVVILVPGFPRLKEWVYAGFVFDLGMAIYSFIAMGDPISSTLFIVFGLVLVFGSYIFYHKRLKLASANRTTSSLAGAV